MLSLGGSARQTGGLRDAKRKETVMSTDTNVVSQADVVAAEAAAAQEPVILGVLRPSGSVAKVDSSPVYPDVLAWGGRSAGRRGAGHRGVLIEAEPDLHLDRGR